MKLFRLDLEPSSCLGPGIIADYNNKIIETFEGNNATSKPYNLPPCNLPDLKVTFQIKNETTFGSPIKKYLYAVTENIGQSASGACKLLETINDSSNKSYPIPSLAPGQKSFIRLKRMPTFPLNPIPTKKKIYINADYQYQVNECYEDNNSETGYF